MIQITTCSGYESLPAHFDPVRVPSRAASIFRSPTWLETFARCGVEAGARFRLYAVEADGVPLAVLPAVVSRLYAVHPRARVLHFIQPEGEPYSPLFASEHPDLTRILDGLIECLAFEPRRSDVIRISPIESDTALARELAASLRRRRFPLQIYRHLDDRYEITEGISSDAYLAARPSALQTLLRGMGQPFFDNGRAKFRLFSEAGEVDEGFEAYEHVLEWNPGEAETEPEGYVRSLMRVAADAGALRLGTIFFDREPAAVQLWIVSAGIARCIRIWSDPRHARLPLDDMLIERLVPQLLDVDCVRELDFGSIESEMAQNWAPQTRLRVGIIAFNPRTWRGLKGVLRHIVLPKLLAFPRRVRRKLRGRWG